MSVMELGALGEFLGVFALVATLIYLAIQVRQSRMQMKASTTQARMGTSLLSRFGTHSLATR